MKSKKAKFECNYSSSFMESKITIFPETEEQDVAIGFDCTETLADKLEKFLANNKGQILLSFRLTTVEDANPSHFSEEVTDALTGSDDDSQTNNKEVEEKSSTDTQEVKIDAEGNYSG